MEKYEPPEYDLFNLNNGSTAIGTTPASLLYEGQANAAVIVPPDLTSVSYTHLTLPTILRV